MMTSSAVLRNAARQVDYYADFQTQIFTFFEFSVSRNNFRPTKLGIMNPGSWVKKITVADSTPMGMPNILQKEFWFYLIRLRNYEFSSLQHMPAFRNTADDVIIFVNKVKGPSGPMSMVAGIENPG
ncbi:hypothetical protein PRIPAC_82393 [Pristionchus pacificus]|uniref:Uncharacterized protein n=1 Tax=Pristionchus pacificus TaxID=54126 RepID=A0A2A6BH01_PRIPA|nr:hypothetical protein PRIPAC_82393 [Pristionchus pacificus]|eukprot:PDM65174.1 hypothetical protein PRIPAC_52116 [Pristionchus pacificus]